MISDDDDVLKLDLDEDETIVPSNSDRDRVLQEITDQVSEYFPTMKVNDVINGQRTSTKGYCDCGYRHLVDGVEKDFVLYAKISNKEYPIGFDLDDNPFDVAKSFFHRNQINPSDDMFHETFEKISLAIEQGNERKNEEEKKNQKELEILQSEEIQRKLQQAAQDRRNASLKMNEELKKKRMKELEEKKRVQEQIKRDQEELKKKKKERLDRLLRQNNNATNKKVVIGPDGNLVEVDESKPKTSKEDKKKDSNTTIDSQLSSMMNHLSINRQLLMIIARLGPNETEEKLVEMGYDREEAKHLIQDSLSQFSSTENFVNIALANSMGNDSKQRRGGGYILGKHSDDESNEINDEVNDVQGGFTDNSENKLIEVDLSQPTTKIKIQLLNGESITIEANMDHTIIDLMQHISIKTSENVSDFVLMTHFPRKKLTQTDGTIKELDLANAKLLQVRK